MMKRSSVIGGAAIITAFSLVCKLLGTVLRLYTASRMGGEGTGLFSLIMSIYTFFTAVSVSWITPAVSRLAAKYDASGGGYGAFAAVLLPSAVISALVSCIMYCLSPCLAVYAACDARAVYALRTLALSIPCMALTSCMKGLFISRGEVTVNGTGSLTEQTVKMAITVLMLGVFMRYETDAATLCLGMTVGITGGECFSLIYLGCFSLRAKKRGSADKSAVRREFASIGLPTAVSAAATSLLHTGESVLIPMLLTGYSGDRSYALSQFGVIRGMAMPLLFFPFALLSGLTAMTVPELSRLSASGDTGGVRKQAKLGMTLAYVFGTVSGCFFFFASDTAASVLYPSSDVAYPLMIIAPVTAFMYAETVADAMLKALCQEKMTLVFCLINSAFRVLSAVLLIPRFGMNGYLVILVLSNILQHILAVTRLHKTAGYRIVYTKAVLMPLVGSVAGGMISRAAASGITGVRIKLTVTCLVFAVIALPSCLPAMADLKRK